MHGAAVSTMEESKRGGRHPGDMHSKPAPVPMVVPSSKIREGVAEHKSCAWCECCSCGPLDSLRCTCVVVRHATRGTQDVAADQTKSRVDGLMVEIQAQGRFSELLGDEISPYVARASSRRSGRTRAGNMYAASSMGEQAAASSNPPNRVA